MANEMNYTVDMRYGIIHAPIAINVQIIKSLESFRIITSGLSRENEKETILHNFSIALQVGRGRLLPEYRMVGIKLLYIVSLPPNVSIFQYEQYEVIWLIRKDYPSLT